MATATLPFPVASRGSTRQSFDIGPVTLNASASSPQNPIQIPAVGYLKSLKLLVTGTITGGTTAAFTADAPFNVIQLVNFRTASGNDIIVPMTGYQLFQVNKYGGYYVNGDPRNPTAYTATTNGTTGSFSFFLDVPLQIDPVTGFCALPAMASNRSYQLNLTLAPVTAVMTGTPTISVSVNAYAEFWMEPLQATKSGTSQQTQPQGIGSVSKWEIEYPSINPGDRLVKFNNVGNVLRCNILTVRDSTGARITDGNGWPTSGEVQLILDNETDFAWPTAYWKKYMADWFNLNSASLDVYGGLDTGVYVYPWHAMNGAVAGDPNNTRSQLLPTINASQVQLRATFGSSISTLEIMTNAVIPVAGSGFADLFAK